MREDYTKMSTRRWETPRLIVLGRGTPEERVLESCKVGGLNGPPEKNGCKDKGTECSALVAS